MCHFAHPWFEKYYFTHLGFKTLADVTHLAQFCYTNILNIWKTYFILSKLGFRHKVGSHSQNSPTYDVISKNHLIWNYNHDSLLEHLGISVGDKAWGSKSLLWDICDLGFYNFPKFKVCNKSFLGIFSFCVCDKFSCLLSSPFVTLRHILTYVLTVVPKTLWSPIKVAFRCLFASVGCEFYPCVVPLIPYLEFFKSESGP